MVPAPLTVSSKVVANVSELANEVSHTKTFILGVQWNTQMSRALTPSFLTQEVLQYRQHVTHTNPIIHEDNPWTWWKQHGHLFSTPSLHLLYCSKSHAVVYTGKGISSLKYFSNYHITNSTLVSRPGLLTGSLTLWHVSLRVTWLRQVLKRVLNPFWNYLLFVRRTSGPPVTGGYYCVVVSSLVLPFSWTGVKIKMRDYLLIIETVTFMYVITRSSAPFHCDLDNLDIVDGVHISWREHTFKL